jgi:hypothetical protein
VEFIVAAAIGLNPYAGVLILAAMAAFTDTVPMSPIGALVPGAVWPLAALAFGLAMPIDFVSCKLVGSVPRARAIGHVLAPLSAGLAAAAVQQTSLPTPVVVALAALLAWVMNTTVTANAARLSRSPEWIGLGHIPVLMSATVAAACIVPLGLALPALGYGLGGFAVLMLGLAELDGRTGAGRPARATARPATRRPRQRQTAPAVATMAASPVAAQGLPGLRSVGRASGRAYARAYARSF